MDAMRWVAEGTRAMRGTLRPERVVEEAWRAYELAEALSRLAGGGRVRPAAARGAGGPGGGTGAGPPGTALLTGVRDPAAVAEALRALLGEIGAALVRLACEARDESAYCHFIDALDAVDEAKDQVEKVARRLGGDAAAYEGDRRADAGEDTGQEGGRG